MGEHYGGIAQVLGGIALVLGGVAGVLKAQAARDKFRGLLKGLWYIVHGDPRIPAPLRRDIEAELGADDPDEEREA